jgi:N-acetyltransferase
MDLQPTHLANELITLVPLESDEFEALFTVASDPAIWVQHPSKNRYEREVFQGFFDSAIASGSAFKIIDSKTNEIIGSSRYYDVDLENRSIAIGYTFLATKYWGTDYNKLLKNLMLDYAFNFADTIIFHVGDTNIRSQKAVVKLGAKKIGTEQRSFSGVDMINIVYSISKQDWHQNK